MAGRPVGSVLPLTGGMSTATHQLVLSDGSSVVLRRFLNRGWTELDPGVAAREALVLRHLEPTAVPAPALIGVDPSGRRCGAPALLMEFMPGQRRPTTDPRSLAQLARVLAQIHDCPPPSGLPDETGRLDRAFAQDRPIRVEDGAAPDAEFWSLVRDRRAAAEPGPPALIHNDFSHSNVLFDHSQLSAVLDWNEASAGQPGYDVCFCRVNLTLTFGPGPADLMLASVRSRDGKPGRGSPLVGPGRRRPGRTGSSNLDRQRQLPRASWPLGAGRARALRGIRPGRRCGLSPRRRLLSCSSCRADQLMV
jgi:aminoglycoside phosphotransferase (APT) family kinase protein